MDAGFVLDCSTTLAWYFADEADDYANGVAAALPSVAAIVPAVWPLEVANALIMGERRKRSTPEQATQWLRFLERLPIVVEEQASKRVWSDVVDLARQHKLTSYDASYLELAQRRTLPIASLDDTLKNAARKLGIKAYQPA